MQMKFTFEISGIAYTMMWQIDELMFFHNIKTLIYMRLNCAFHCIISIAKMSNRLIKKLIRRKCGQFS